MKSSNKFSFFIDNKKGFELSINFLVVIILSFVILVLGIYLFTQIQGGVDDLYREVSQDAKDDIFSILDKSQDELVFIPNIIKEVEQGETARFPLGIRSDTSKCGGGREAQFEISVKPEIIVNQNNKEVFPKIDMEGWYFTEPLVVKVKNNDKTIVDSPIVAGLGSEGGFTYGFDLKITCDGVNPYGGRSHKLFIVVK